jgi:hypothetical protein
MAGRSKSLPEFCERLIEKKMDMTVLVQEEAEFKMHLQLKRKLYLHLVGTFR